MDKARGDTSTILQPANWGVSPATLEEKKDSLRIET